MPSVICGVEVADGSLISFLRHLETVVDEFRVAVVAQVTTATVLVKIAQEGLGEVESVAVASRLQREVNFSVLAHMVHVGRHAVAGAQLLEYLVVIELPLVVGDYRLYSGYRVYRVYRAYSPYNGLEAQVGLLPDKAVYSIAVVQPPLFLV